ncbi:MAG TPA: helix-turn-helix transcriptional regulator [Syntrophales bacterium]|nr:helix-turn-helix transcriptional regulator [Syntrophales bacterium]
MKEENEVKVREGAPDGTQLEFDFPRVLLNTAIGRRIRIIRKRARLSQMDLARAAGYTSSGMLSQIERGLVGMELSKLLRVADALGVHPVALLSDLDLTDEQLIHLSEFAKLLKSPNPKNLEAILTLLKDAIDEKKGLRTARPRVIIAP